MEITKSTSKINNYPQRVAKSEAMFANWEAGDGDMGELAVGLYDLVAEYKALWNDYVALEAEVGRLKDPAPPPEGAADARVPDRMRRRTRPQSHC